MNDALSHFRAHLYHDEGLGFWLDTSRVRAPEGFLPSLTQRLTSAYAAMNALEGGAIANTDENRMVGHYWLRAPDLAPDPAISEAVTTTLTRIHAFASDVHAARIRPAKASKFQHLLVIGIGGSALGPELVAAALGSPADRMRVWFFDNTDPDGFDRVLDAIGDGLSATLCVVISKSGGTKETRNGMLEAESAYTRLGLDFAKHAVAVTGEGSELDRYAIARSFLDRFPMWDWVGGRTSELSAVGLLPAALQGLDINGLLEGARRMDVLTRRSVTETNPAALLAAAWLAETGGVGKKDMVFLPYKDRLELFSRYAQQLVMESLGKELDRSGTAVFQGIAVYGNKGSTDQHAYVQQLRDGVDNAFVTFIEVLRDRAPQRLTIEVEKDVTSGDYLSGFLQGTRRALSERGRGSITITLETLDAVSLGALIALYERAVGLYAELVGINAYHQPGVEAGKKAAKDVIDLQKRVLGVLESRMGEALTLDEISRLTSSDDAETVFWILRHLSASPGRRIERVKTPQGATGANASPLDWCYRMIATP